MFFPTSWTTIFQAFQADVVTAASPASRGRGGGDRRGRSAVLLVAPQLEQADQLRGGRVACGAVAAGGWWRKVRVWYTVGSVGVRERWRKGDKNISEVLEHVRCPVNG